MQGMGILLQGLQSDLNGPSECQKSMEACHGNRLPGKRVVVVRQQVGEVTGTVGAKARWKVMTQTRTHTQTRLLLFGTAKTGQILQNKKFKNKIKKKAYSWLKLVEFQKKSA